VGISDFRPMGESGSCRLVPLGVMAYSGAKAGGSSMNEAKIKGKWEQLKGRVEERWGQLTGNDLAVMQGRQEQFVGKLQEVYGFS